MNCFIVSSKFRLGRVVDGGDKRFGLGFEEGDVVAVEGGVGQFLEDGGVGGGRLR